LDSKVHVFLLAGNRLLREALTRVLRKRADMAVVGAAPYSPQALAEVTESGCQVLLLDSLTSALPDVDFVQEAIRAVPGLKVILIGMDEDKATFLRAVRAGAVGYVLKDASAVDVAAAVRNAAQDEAVCPPRLCLSLFRYMAKDATGMPDIRVKVQLGLTCRQQQLVPLIAQGLTNKEIATQLNLSEQTVKNHIHRMLQKVGADDRLAVVRMVRLQGLLI
jgi:DNA-binding NarL/FixJ family response regulator